MQTRPTTTRRDMLRLGTSAAAYAAGAALVTGAVALASEAKGTAPDRLTWNTALSRCHAARTEYDAAIDLCDDAPIGSDAYRLALAEEHRTSAIDSAAMEKLLSTPAP